MPSLSWISYGPEDRNRHSTIVTLRAVCTIQAAWECGATSAMWTRRLLKWMKNKT